MERGGVLELNVSFRKYHIKRYEVDGWMDVCVWPVVANPVACSSIRRENKVRVVVFDMYGEIQKSEQSGD
jgi:hypothetical protein